MREYSFQILAFALQLAEVFGNSLRDWTLWEIPEKHEDKVMHSIVILEGWCCIVACGRPHIYLPTETAAVTPQTHDQSQALTTIAYPGHGVHTAFIASKDRQCWDEKQMGAIHIC